MFDARSLAGLIATHSHEQVVFVADAESGLRAVIAIHSTALGPSLGGVRFWHYEDESAAVLDAIRLSEAMSFKASAAGLHVGGGKAVVMLAEPFAPHPDGMLRALGRAIDDLGGRYLAAEDVGATPHDMDVIATETRWVTGVDRGRGGSGDPSPMTAFGVLCGMHAACSTVFGSRTLTGRHVVIQGAGHVGAELARLLVALDARVSVADVDERRVAALVGELGVAALPSEAVFDTSGDVFAPCALGGALNDETVPRLQFPIVAGAANNQLAHPEIDDVLVGRGILYAPDFVINAGGIINLAAEFTGYDAEVALRDTARIELRTGQIFAEARNQGIAPGRAAERFARERIKREALPGGRFRPGDATAWTNGLPLTRLRPNT